MNAQHFLSSSEKQTVEQAIAQAEQRTSAEIVCAIATESGRYDRAESIIGVLFSLLALGVANWVPSLFAPENTWAAEARPGLILQSGAVLAGFILGSFLASYWHGLRRLVCGAEERESESVRAANHVFHEGRLACTQGATGVLFYVSLFERRVVILADEAATAVLGQEMIEQLRDMAVEGLRQGKRGEVFKRLVEEIGRAHV